MWSGVDTIHFDDNGFFPERDVQSSNAALDLDASSVEAPLWGGEEGDAVDTMDGDGGGDDAVEPETYPLPPLPEPVLPTEVYQQPLDSVYLVIQQLRRAVDVTSQQQGIRDLLRNEMDIGTLKAVAAVLNQCGLLRRPVLQRDGSETWEAVPLPARPAPTLPAGITSWIASSAAVVNPADPLRHHQAGGQMSGGSGGYYNYTPAAAQQSFQAPYSF